MRRPLPALIAALVLSACSDEMPSTVECGNGVLDQGEACDDGNGTAGDGCTPSCTVEDGYTCSQGSCAIICGDGVVGGDEECEPIDTSVHCSDDCRIVGSCGDGVVQPEYEQCDHGPSQSECSFCDAAYGWECDPGTNQCDASAVDPMVVLGNMTTEERAALCEWLIGVLGGPGAMHECGGTLFTINTVAECTQSLTFPGQVGGCNVGDLEHWVGARGSACAVLTSQESVCFLGAPRVFVAQGR